MTKVGIKTLLDAGSHFGHQTRRWNPKMKPYIFGSRGDIYIIDLKQTLVGLDQAYTFVSELAKKGGTVLFVGTKKQAQEAVSEAANRCGMPYVNARWLGGMLTNFVTIRSRVTRMEELEAMEADGRMAVLPKKEQILLRKELSKLQTNLNGIRNMKRTPDAVFVIDTNREAIAIHEARRLNIPVVGTLDTNCDPDDVDYGIPANDDAIRSVRLLADFVADAVVAGVGAPVTAAEMAGEARPLRPPPPRLLPLPRRPPLRRPPRPLPRLPSSRPSHRTNAPPSGRRSHPARRIEARIARERNNVADITASMVKELREMTGAGMMECKKALVEAEGDMDKAVDVLRTRGLAAVAKKAGRATNEGTVMAIVSDDATTGAVVEINCETDFVGMNDKFKAYAEKIARAALAAKPADLEALKAADAEGETVEAVVTDAIHTLGENVQLARFAVVEGGAVSSYIHGGGKIGVLVQFDVEGIDPASSEFAQYGRDVAMQVAAAAPVAANREAVDPAIVEHEKAIYMAQAAESGKPEAIQEKMATGRLEKFFKENTLTEQAFVKNPDQSVADYTAEVAKSLGGDIKITGFKRFVLGEEA